MSGTFQTNLTPVWTEVAPNEGSKACFVSIQWAQTFASGTPGVAPLNFLQQYQTNKFTALQSVYVDNSTVPYEVRLTCNETQFLICIPPFTQGMYPLMCSNSPTFTVVLFYTVDQQSALVNFNCTTDLTFLNTPQNRYQYELPKYGNNFGNLTTLVDFVNAANVNPALDQYFWDSETQILPPAGPNTYYLLTALQLNIIQDGEYSTPQFDNEFFIEELFTNAPGGANNWLRYRALFSWNGTSSLPALLNANMTFDPPILTGNPNCGIAVRLSEQTPTIDGPFPDSSGRIRVGFTLCYGTVLIE